MFSMFLYPNQISSFAESCGMPILEAIASNGYPDVEVYEIPLVVGDAPRFIGVSRLPTKDD